MVELTADPVVATVDGENEHASPEGSPEQLKLTAWLNPFSGVTDSVKVADWLASIGALPGEADSVKVAGGRLMVYAADATALLSSPGATAIASMVSVLLTAMALVYFVDEVV